MGQQLLIGMYSTVVEMNVFQDITLMIFILLFFSKTAHSIMLKFSPMPYSTPKTC